MALLLAYGCGRTTVKGFWNSHSTDLTDIRAAEDQFADFAELAVAAPESEAIAELDILYNFLAGNEVLYYIYSSWMEGAFYSLYSPCRNSALFSHAVERMLKDGVMTMEDIEPLARERSWMENNLPGQEATVPGVLLDGRRTVVIVLDFGCSSCHKALTELKSNPICKDNRLVAINCGKGPVPDVPGWEYYSPDNAEAVFDPHMTPVYFIIAADGSVDTSYTLVL